jgi:hypothetical protein
MSRLGRPRQLGHADGVVGGEHLHAEIHADPLRAAYPHRPPAVKRGWAGGGRRW